MNNIRARIRLTKHGRTFEKRSLWDRILRRDPKPTTRTKKGPINTFDPWNLLRWWEKVWSWILLLFGKKSSALKRAEEVRWNI